MSFEKQVITDKIEVIESGHIQIRKAIRVVENGSVIAQSYERKVIAPGDDYSGEEARVQAICVATHTPEVIAAYKAAIAAQGV
jgi:hypothetical protein